MWPWWVYSPINAHLPGIVASYLCQDQLSQIPINRLNANLLLDRRPGPDQVYSLVGAGEACGVRHAISTDPQAQWESKCLCMHPPHTLPIISKLRGRSISSSLLTLERVLSDTSSLHWCAFLLAWNFSKSIKCMEVSATIMCQKENRDDSSWLPVEIKCTLNWRCGSMRWYPGVYQVRSQ